ncbi:glycosyltransferase [Desulfosporosinus sp. SYSU MS00001]|uniref:glycosyltransferase n=1 Tax=Desulfosporosinus sp. SYSU MS00001 TaxID=3416284 RepID=UPI003CF22C4F
MKILQIPNYMYPNIGGVEQVGRDIVNVLQGESDIEQKIICFNEHASDGDYICKRKETVHDQVDGVDVIRCGCIAKIQSQSLSLTYAQELSKLINDFQPEVVIFHYPNPFVASLLSKYMKRNLRLILYWHLDITQQKLLGKLFHGQTIRLLEWADVVVATSPNYIEGSPYLNRYKNKCIVVPNCIGTRRMQITEEISIKADQLRKKYEGKMLCFGLGRHIPYKGFTYLIKASKLLDDNFRICIGGKGPLTERLQTEAQGDAKIAFLGRISNEEMVAYYLACDIFCFPSITKNEAFGIALAEGMYFGKPAVTFKIVGSGVNYVNINGVTGIECPNGNVEAYAGALRKLASDTELRKKLGKNARQRVNEQFMREQFSKKIKSLINSLR